MTVAEIIDQVRRLDPGELFALRQVLDEMTDTSLHQSAEKSSPYRLVPVDMGSPLVNLDKALHMG